MADPKEVTADGYPHKGDAEIEWEWMAWRTMTPLERLRRFQR